MSGVLNLWEKWEHLPWRHFGNPFDQWQVLPTFLIGEYTFIALTVLLFVHAYKQGRVHLIAWFAAFFTGSANDIFFMALPLVDNFWQAQATIMTTPRFPIYISCVYIVFMYSAAMAVWRLRLPPLAEAALAGLMGEMIYSPYDITGIKFLWWTWHDTDPPIAARVLGVPLGSSLWVITFTATFVFVLRHILVNRRAWPAPVVLFISALVSTPLMMVQMAVLQLLSGDQQGKPTERSFLLGIGVYLAIILITIVRQPFGQRRHPATAFIKSSLDKTPKVALLVYYLILNVLMAWGIPENHISTGVHQTIGPCNVSQVDLTGLSREKYLCPAHHTQDWHFGCAPGGKAPEGIVEWYTVCGRAHTNYPLWQGAIVGLGLLGGTTYYRTLTSRSSTKVQ